jgi:hypothetical protein
MPVPGMGGVEAAAEQADAQPAIIAPGWDRGIGRPGRFRRAQEQPAPSGGCSGLRSGLNANPL